MPFIHLSAKTSGALRLCCESANSDIEPRAVLGQSPQLMNEVWHGKFYEEIRQRMKNGEKIEACSICYKKEDRGIRSRRLEHNQAWSEKLGKEEYLALKNGDKKLPSPLYLDLRQGALCNLKCRMCNSMTSTTFAKEWQELQENKGDLSPEHFPEEQDLLRYSKKMSPWYESAHFWSELLQMAPSLKKLYLTGGEPLLIQNNTKLLNTLISVGNTEAEIVINTNLTILSQDFLKAFEKFTHSNLSLSLDGVGKTNDYIRFPSKWEETQKNFNQLKNHNISVDITFTLQAYNFFEVIAFLKWFNEEALEHVGYIDWNILDIPHYLAFDIIPQAQRLKEIERIERYLQESENNQNKKIYEKLRDKFSFLSKEQAPRAICEQFRRYSVMLDNKRQQKLEEEIPSLSFLMSMKDER